MEHVVPQLEANEVVSFLAFHDRGHGYPAHWFFRGLLHEWKVQLQHLNPNSELHIAGFMTLCEIFLGIDLHVDLLRAYFLCKVMTVRGDTLPVPIGEFSF